MTCFINDPKFRWQKKSDLTFKGSTEFAEKIQNAVSSDLNLLKETLQTIDDFSSGVVETDDYLIAWVDHIRSWPLFYYHENEKFYLSQNAYKVKDSMADPTYNEDNLLEFKMSGYVTGNCTVIDGLHALNPGEFCIWHKKEKTLKIDKYFSYVPSFDSEISQRNAIETLNNIFDELTLKIIRKAKDKTIWIPLSGGLDSRILLCKLHEHGFTNIRTFTYGPRFNFESFIAKKVAKKMNVPWQFVSVPKAKLKKYFDSDERVDFWNYAMNLKSIPCMREYSAIMHLKETGQIDKGSIFLNGQSGDYITGAHISSACKTKADYDKDSFYDVIIDKHYDLWKQYKTPENLKIIKNKINNVVKSITGHDIDIQNQIDGAKHEEIWEYEARQICYVVNGQRIYEYLGYDWEMPLWEKRLVDFCQPLSFDMKYGQKVYKDYLQSYNYKGLFPQKEPYIWRWPLPMLWVVPVAQIIGLFGGRKTKETFYAQMRYWGHYANQYKFFSLETHRKTASSARSIISLYIPEWIKNNRLRF